MSGGLNLTPSSSKMANVSTVVDVAVETTAGASYQFLNVALDTLNGAVGKALQDQVAFSLVSKDSAAIVIPWSLVQGIRYISVLDASEHEDAWAELWRRSS